MDQEPMDLLSNLASPTVFAVFAVMLWKRTERTLNFYESTLSTMWASIAKVLGEIDERTRACPRQPKEPEE